MIARIAFILLLSALAPVRAQVASSVNYAFTAISIDAGGRSSASANYQSDIVINPLGGQSASPNYVAILGFGGQLNNPPIANPDIAARRTNEIANISIEYLIANDIDPDGDALRLFDADRSTPAGGNIGFFPNRLEYTPPPAFNGVDTFTYTIADDFNDTATSTVTVVVAHLPATQTENSVLMYFLNDGQILVRLEAAPTFSSYTIQWTDDLANPVWRDLATTGAGSDGTLLGIDNPEGDSQRYYRAVLR